MEKELKNLLDTAITGEMYYSSKKYVDREFSWMEFNKRVLYRALDKRIPLGERFNFLGITTSNLDEFIMVRVSSVLNKMAKNDKSPELSGLDAKTEYNTLIDSIIKFNDLQSKTYKSLIKKLNNEGIQICRYGDLTGNEKKSVSELFFTRIQPLLTPINYNSTTDFPMLKSKEMHMVVSLESYNSDTQVISFISLAGLPKIFRIPTKGGCKFILLEDIVSKFLDTIYYGKKIIDYGTIRILREADIELEQDTDIYIVDRMRKALHEREYSDPVYMQVSNTLDKSLIKILSKIFGLNKKRIYVNDGPIDYTSFQEMKLPDDKYYYKKFVPQYPSDLIGVHDMFTAIDNGDILLHHPYESFDPVIKFLEHAAYDKHTVAIKQTLYRVSSYDSPIVNALCRAAENGKHVSVILEIKARFDEERNLSLIEKLRLSGCKLIYGVEQLKTHCKFISVIRQVGDSLRIYSHIGTGNYNDKTAKIYTDISYFTSNFKIGQDILSMSNMLSGFSEPSVKINKIFFSPYNLRKRLYKSIDNEISNAEKGKFASIVIKVNSISDQQMIDKLYEAADKGVNINIFCRGICSIKPNKNIVIRSLVGRYLEHSRIYYFGNNKNPDIYISSADLLTRNLDKRFEILFPVTDSECKEKLIKILSLYYKDTVNSFEMNKKGEYTQLLNKDDVDIHHFFMDEAIENYKLKNIPKMMSFKKK